MPKKVLIEKKRYKKKSGGKRISLILNGPSGKGGGLPPRRLKARSADSSPFLSPLKKGPFGLLTRRILNDSLHRESGFLPDAASEMLLGSSPGGKFIR